MTGIYIEVSKRKEPLNSKDPYESIKRLEHRGKFVTMVLQTDSFFVMSSFNRHSKQYYDCICECKQMNTEDTDFCVIDGQIYTIDANIDEKLSNGSNSTPAIKIHDLYTRYGLDAFLNIHGIYSLVLKHGDKFIAIKDPVGCNPLYIAEDSKNMIFASELKAFPKYMESIWILPPGCAFIFDRNKDLKELARFYNYDSLLKRSQHLERDLQSITQRIRFILTESVKNAMNIKGSVGALMSGGLDSSIICALALQQNPKIPLFTIGVKDSEDVKHAKLFSRQYPDIEHYIYSISFEDIKRAVPSVIESLETFDAALIRSAVPMYILCSKIQNKIDVLLTGEGADELFGGYEYLKKMKHNQLNLELLKLLDVEHATGLQRVDRIPYTFGIEARAPFFDLPLVEYSFYVPPEYKIKQQDGEYIEKWILRDAFKDMIPTEIAFRKKAKFSQGVGSELLLRDHFEKIISDREFEAEKEITKGVFVKSKEELYYWRIFNKKFDVPETFIRSLPRTSHFTI